MAIVCIVIGFLIGGPIGAIIAFVIYSAFTINR